MIHNEQHAQYPQGDFSKPTSYLSAKFDEAKTSYTGKRDRPTMGDHLVTPRLGYTHHGIYVGNNQVVHYAGLADGFNAAPVERCTVEQFASGNHILVKKVTKRAFDRATSIKRAVSRLGESEYNVMFNNCEHFVNWCIHGRASSPQIAEYCLLLGLNRTLAGTAIGGVGSLAGTAIGGVGSLAGTAIGGVGSLAGTAIGGVASVGGLVAITAAPVVVGVAVVYGAKKLWDELTE